MGGNALKHLNVVRVDTNTLIGVFNSFYRLFNIHEINCYIVPWIESKQDHGDLDIIVNSTKDEVFELLKSKKFMINKSKTNDNVISMPYDVGNNKLLQVDFICTPNSHWTRFFYSGGDFGLYMGRVCSAYGLVFATDGFRLRADPEVNWMKDITLTDEPSSFLSVMEYDNPPRFIKEEDLWNYILSSKFAKPWMFLPKSTNAENRSRDKQRPAVQRFQNWLMNKIESEKELDQHKFSYDEAYCFACNNFDSSIINSEIIDQENEFNLNKEVNAIFGVSAVDKALTKNFDVSKFKIGWINEVIKDMQSMLPPKNERFNIYKHSPDIAEKIAISAAKISLEKLKIKYINKLL